MNVESEYETISISKMYIRIALYVFINYNMDILKNWWNINEVFKTQLHANL